MATEAVSGELPRSASRYRMLRGKSISSPRVLDIFRDSDEPDQSPVRRTRSSSVHTLKAARAEKSAPDVPPLPSYALTPKPVNIPPPPTFKNRDNGKIPTSAIQAKIATDDVHEKHATEPLGEQSPAPSVRTKSMARRLVFGKKELENEPLPDTEVHRSIAEQKKQDLARLQATLVTPPPKPKTSLLSLFSRSKKLATPTLTVPDTPSSIATTVFTSRGTSMETASTPDSVKFSDSIEKPIPVSVPYPQSTPTTYAPLDFERRVAVRCQSSTINLPVSLETNAVDILLMASTMMRHRINPASSVVVESYLVLGLERRLRRYERIRDVMNTWDQDHENSLLILSCPASMSDHDLDIDAVPDSTEAPPGFTLQLHQSARPGKWNKRWITLLENGQMYSSKTADALPGDAACVKLCHLSDFDIYSPKEAEVRHSVKPPKQFCYAIKSQQKSTLFADEANFVHYFSTDKEEVATQFYELVHGWRSWHLVSKKLALDRKMNVPAPQLTFDSANGPDTSAEERKIDSESPSATSSFRIGTFQPLLDVGNISKLAEEARKLLPVVVPTPVIEEEKHEAHPPQPNFPPPSTPTPKAKEQPVKPSLKPADTDKKSGSPPNPMYHPSPGPLGMDCVKSSPQADSTSLEFDAFSFDVPEDKPEPKSWFPSAAEHTAKIRKDEPPPSFRRPATADPALYGSPRRGNPQLSIKTHFLEPPRPFDYFGAPPPKLGANTPLIYKLPGTPMLPTAPRARPMSNSKSGSVGPVSPPNDTRARSRSTVANPQMGRHMPKNMPPVPPLPHRSMKRDTPPTTPIVSVQPRYPPPQRGPALQPFPAHQI